MLSFTSKDIIQELEFTNSRSSGAGGQNVNKVNSKVTLRWNLKNSTATSAEQRDWLLQKLDHQLTKEGDLIINSQEHRSQLQNRDEVIQKLDKLLFSIFKRRKARKASKPSKTSIKKRLESKRKHSDKKQLRKRLE